MNSLLNIRVYAEIDGQTREFENISDLLEFVKILQKLTSGISKHLLSPPSAGDKRTISPHNTNSALRRRIGGMTTVDHILRIVHVGDVVSPTTLINKMRGAGWTSGAKNDVYAKTAIRNVLNGYPHYFQKRADGGWLVISLPNTTSPNYVEDEI